MAKKKTSKKGGDFFGYSVSDSPVFVVSIGVLIIALIVFFVNYLSVFNQY